MLTPGSLFNIVSHLASHLLHRVKHLMARIQMNNMYKTALSEKTEIVCLKKGLSWFKFIVSYFLCLGFVAWHKYFGGQQWVKKISYPKSHRL